MGSRIRSLSHGEWARVIGLGIPGTLSFAFLIYVGAFAAAPAAPDLDARHCPRHTAPAEAVLVMIDATDAFSPSQVATFKKVFAGVLRDAVPTEFVSVAEIRALPAHFIVGLCSPDRGAQPVYSYLLLHPYFDWHRMRASWQREFDRPMAEAAAELPFYQVWPKSPIIQSIDDATRRLGDVWLHAKHRRLIIFSDMMENTVAYSDYRERLVPLSFADARVSIPYIRDAAPMLKNTDVSVYYRLVPHDGRHQEGAERRTHEVFWHDFFAAHGGRVGVFSVLPFN
jgi:hypothetical protein